MKEQRGAAACLPLPAVRLVTANQVARLLGQGRPEAFLSPHEIETFAAFPLEKRRRDWAAGRLAAKVLVRQTLLERFGREIPLAAVVIGNDDGGAPFLELPGQADAARAWSMRQFTLWRGGPRTLTARPADPALAESPRVTAAWEVVGRHVLAYATCRRSRGSA